jgi:O-antigen/teichoic acid export membrane protein
MFAPIRRLGTDTAIYGISTILGRFLNFLLVPFYTQVLHPGEYGIVAYVYSIIAFLNIVYVYGMESAYFKYASTGELGSPRQNFTTPFVSLLVTSLLLSGILAAAASPVSGALGIASGHSSIILYAAGILFLDTAAIIPFAALRMQRKPLLFSSLKFFNIAVNVGCNLYLLLVMHAGVEGVFLSGLIASAFTLVTLIPTIIRNTGDGFSRPLEWALLAFGLPYIPAGLAAMVIQVVDRPVLRILTNDATVGIYQANYRLGILMMLIVSMFDYAWRPFFLAHANEPDAKPLFARVLTYFIAVSSFVFLAISFFISDVVQIRIFGRAIIHPDYWGGLGIVPVVLLAYIFLGVYNNLIAGVYIEKKTRTLPGITIAGAAVNVAANFLLIPVLGMMGAALATLLAYVVMACVLYASVRTYYPVPYEWDRIAKLGLIVAALFALSRWVDGGSLHHLWLGFLLVMFVVLLFVVRFFTPGELRTLRGSGAAGAAE